MPEKLTRKGASWHFRKPEVISKNMTINRAIEIIDVSRESFLITSAEALGIVVDTN